MYLEKLEIQGFKSFANKNILVFPGMLDESKRGITSVVGPNGSGKSNVADAVRWALGEQSMKTLRGKKSEDIIFSGSDKKGKLGMAEVSLFLNNEDKTTPIDYSQVVLTRRLYRNGDSEYMINNSRVRLSDIQMLLAKAKFGQKTYSVIGQGMVEGFLNTTLSERKEFFDEATGVKQYQIKRDDSLNKLRSSYENLMQAEMLLSEIEPRLKSLTRQVNRLKRREEIENELKTLNLVFYRKVWHEINDKFNQYNGQYLELEKIKIAKDKKLVGVNQDLEKLKVDSAGENNFAQWQDELSTVQNEKNDLNRMIAKLEAQTEMKLESSGKFDLSFLISKKEELTIEVSTIGKEMNDLEEKIKTHKEQRASLDGEKEKIDIKIKALNDNLAFLSQRVSVEKDDDVAKFNKDLSRVLKKLSEINEESNVEKIKEVIREVKSEIKIIIDNLGLGNTKEASESVNNEEWQKIQESLNELTNSKENLVLKINENSLNISSCSERLRFLQERKDKIGNELISVETKLKQRSSEFDIKETEEEKSKLKSKLLALEEKIDDIQKKINNLNSQEEEKRNQLFVIQKEIQSLQNEINSLSNQLNEIKINSTRYETRLEDLEVEIREELGLLKEVKQERVRDEVNEEDLKEKIVALKKQLEQIGGIDPQVEKEYSETKERYDFLSGQVDDLTKAIGSLEKIIKELDATIKDNFDKEFKVIAQKFEKYFKILFNGGSAKIVKVMEEDLASKNEEADTSDNAQSLDGSKQKEESGKTDIKRIKFLQKHNATGLAGIEIQATPPGKKIKVITMLSGGERALTAIALICAIISSNPSPFVVLDEVDASLDEANSERLAKILDELSHKTQFIVITHNRASMRRASILYGVTMGDDGVSKLLSIKLEEAKEVVKN